MSNIKKHGLVFGSQELFCADDEDLSVLAQKGNKTAYNILCSRYMNTERQFHFVKREGNTPVLRLLRQTPVRIDMKTY